MQVKVFKFGGASVKDAVSVRNVAAILRNYPDQPLVVVVSAMGKTTNALEKLVNAYVGQEPATEALLQDVITFHSAILTDLFPDQQHPVYREMAALIKGLRTLLDQPAGGSYDYEYDQVVVYGELFSSCLLSHYLNESGLSCTLFDARKLVFTSSSHRHAKVDWKKSTREIRNSLRKLFSSPLFNQIAVTQGFIGSDTHGASTTLGREGSDYTAAIFAHALDALEVIIWKDVPGLLNADPKYFPDSRKIDRISYKETLELSYYGAGVIHPDTIKPLQNKGIPLYVKSFLDPEAPGTLICELPENEEQTATGVDKNEAFIPCFIIKTAQWLISISSRDFSYIEEESLHRIFGIFSSMGIKINMMQNSAISFSVCIDHPGEKKNELIDALQKFFLIRFNEDLQLITIRNYTQEIIEKLVDDKQVFLEQKSRHTCQLVVQDHQHTSTPAHQHTSTPAHQQTEH